jgi:hypothetical protein
MDREADAGHKSEAKDRTLRPLIEALSLGSSDCVEEFCHVLQAKEQDSVEVWEGVAWTSFLMCV